MNWIYKMEKKFGKYAIPNLPLVIAIVYAAGFIMEYFVPNMIDLFSLNVDAIFHGQVWRLITWILVPEGSMNIFFVLIFLFFYYSIGKNLEAAWGKFFFNVYFLSGVVLTVVGAIILYVCFTLFNPDFVSRVEGAYTIMNGPCPQFLHSWFSVYVSYFFSTYYLNLSIFLAYAMTYPNMRVLLFFIIPIKVKVLGIIYIIILSFSILTDFFQPTSNGINISLETGLLSLISIGMSLLNVFIFFMILRGGKKRRFKEIKRQKEFQKKMKAVSEPVIRHKCAVCGQTDVSNPELTFRYCSKCNGNYEYCNEHLYTHEHIK